MRNLKILIAVLGFTVFTVQSTIAQEGNKTNEKVYSTTVSKSPVKVKETLKKYSGYIISNEATYTKKSDGNIYKIRVTKRNWSHFLLINEDGKIIGIDDGEHSLVTK